MPDTMLPKILPGRTSLTCHHLEHEQCQVAARFELRPSLLTHGLRFEVPRMSP